MSLNLFDVGPISIFILWRQNKKDSIFMKTKKKIQLKAKRTIFEKEIERDLERFTRKWRSILDRSDKTDETKGSLKRKLVIEDEESVSNNKRIKCPNQKDCFPKAHDYLIITPLLLCMRTSTSCPRTNLTIGLRERSDQRMTEISENYTITIIVLTDTTRISVKSLEGIINNFLGQGKFNEFARC